MFDDIFRYFEERIAQLTLLSKLAEAKIDRLTAELRDSLLKDEDWGRRSKGFGAPIAGWLEKKPTAAERKKRCTDLETKVKIIIGP